MNEKADFAVKILRQYAHETGNLLRGTSDISPLEEYLILQLLAAQKKGNADINGRELDEIVSEEIDGLGKYFLDMDDYYDSFTCNECGEFTQENFRYHRDVANGEVWSCKRCNTEIMPPRKPNEDDY